MKNPFLEFSSNENVVTNSKYLKKNDVFLSLKGGAKYLTSDQANLAKHILLDSSETLDLPKVIKIKDLNITYLEWIDEYFDIDHSYFFLQYLFQCEIVFCNRLDIFRLIAFA